MAVSAAARTDPKGLANPYEFATHDDVMTMLWAFESVVESLDSETWATLVEQGCVTDDASRP